LYAIPDGALIDQILANNELISPEAYAAYRTSEFYVMYIVGYQLFTRPGIRFADQEPWERMMSRKYRMFQADVQVNAPVERTLFNYNIKDGWKPLRDFLGLTDTGAEFPHENKSRNTASFMANLWTKCGEDYDNKVEKEVIAWMKANGYHCKKICFNSF